MNVVTAQIDKAALIHNIRKIKELVPQAKIAAVVKANAYGHGLYLVANTLDPYVDGFAAARISEAMSLRDRGIKKPIILLEGLYEPNDVPLIAKYDLDTAVHDMEQVEAIEQAELDGPIKCWMKIDIGMHRLGASPEEVAEMKIRLEQCVNVQKPLGVISHLSVADTPSEYDYNAQQIDYFFKTASGFAGEKCLANSAGILKWPVSHTDWVRPGIILYGISPFAGTTGADFGLQPVMTLKSSLIAVRRVKRGAKVGYGAAWTAPEDTVIGIVATGYGDGYPRTAPNGTPVWVNGRMVPTAGHVCMDMLFVNLGPGAADQVGAPVILWGKEVPVEKIAALCGTIPYELVCRIMPRVNVECVG